MVDPAFKRIGGVQAGTSVSFTFEGAPIEGAAGESVAAALLRAGYLATRSTHKSSTQRGYFCGMGVCWECVVLVAGVGQVRACVHPVRDGLAVHRPSQPNAPANR